MFGKSSFINKISNKNSLKVENKPGVTIKKQWIRLSKNIELLDTPGVLWPKFENNQIGLNLAFTGAIKEEIIDKEEIAFNLIKYLINNHLKEISIKYKLNEEEIQSLLKEEKDENKIIIEIMEQIGKNRGALMSRSEELIIKKFRVSY